MRVAKKKIFIGLGVVLLGLQFVRPAQTHAPDGPDDLLAKYPPPPAVKDILEHACYDCHSNRTRYPWYAQVQPVGWWLGRHIADAKDQINFSEFAAYAARDRAKLLQAVADEVATRSMPLKSYTWTHRDAKLTAAQIKLVVDWSEALAEKIDP